MPDGSEDPADTDESPGSGTHGEEAIERLAGYLERVRGGEAPARVEAELLALLGSSHALAVLQEFALEDGPRRFSELEESLSISPSTLSQRLGEFVDAGLLERRSYDEIPPRVEYRATEATAALEPLFLYLSSWLDQHDVETP